MQGLRALPHLTTTIMSNPIETLAASVHHALLLGLKPLKQPVTKWLEKPDPITKSRMVQTGETKEVRPYSGNTDFVMFQQGWGSTALGFGGIGGQAFTGAYTVIAIGPMGDACVYFGGRFAYRIDRPNQKFREDMASQCMHAVAGARARYEDKKPSAGEPGGL